MASRFDYVRYDENAQLMQENLKEKVQELERNIKGIGINSAMRSTAEQANTVGSLNRSKALALTALEEFYMWVGKAIRDDQILRNGSAPLQEDRAGQQTAPDRV